ncbi:GNAT family N-acetyltransferase [Falsihalocynthiibacter sp. S25ZX9]|uniref:GNAT family N-acetyltransferase n=1 Tax=Falsihalocynthiibacter sp. S25ZX9 TaxID=3240870 RepID=UPI00350EA0D0
MGSHSVAVIRQALPCEGEAIAELGRDFLAHTGAHIPFDLSYAEHTVRTFISDPTRLALVLEKDGAVVGALLAATSSSPFSPVLFAQEVAWWVSPNARSLRSLQMIAQYEAWANSRGCRFVAMASLNDHRLDRFYRRRGFTPMETHYLKGLK